MSQEIKKIVIVGGGAAGFFAANIIHENAPQISITILEQGNKVMQKVKVSGGGRCNVTNAVIEREKLPEYYPRGWKLLRKLFSQFSNEDLINWFENKGIALKTEADNRMFPTTDNSQTIIDGLRNVVRQNNVEVITSCKVTHLNFTNNQWQVDLLKHPSIKADAVLIATGSSNFIYELLAKKGVQIVAPLPSLFTFNIQNDIRLQDIAGIAVQNTIVKIVGDKMTSEGPTLITHWGLSGPAILKLSSWAAQKLHESNYQFTVIVNWSGLHTEECRNHLNRIRESHPNKLVHGNNAFDIPKRLWKKLVQSANIEEQMTWNALSKKHINSLNEQVSNCQFKVNGKSTFKEEFVTCGGVALQEVNSKTLEHKNLKNLFFAGEVLDIDAITGGYNFQAAWTTAYVAAKAICGQDNAT
ncbi:MAG: NAD(P)/FAD-dependent oxidoreductase [Chitinophagales bacterium]